MPISRRGFFRQSALLGGLTLAGPLEAFAARLGVGHNAASARIEGYGPLAPRADETTGLTLLELPEGFRYISFGWTGDPLDGGRFTPGAHDGMAAFRGPGSRVILVRNHEETNGPTFDPAISYDEGAAGGTTTIEFDEADGAWIGGRTSLAGTVRNCAGGPTPWGSWLSCEESLVEPGPEKLFKRPHGYVFEVPLPGRPTCEPLVAMGRFVHEAVAVDPATGIVYETEDAGTSGLYRFTPRVRGELAKGGRLEMLAIDKKPRFDTRTGQRPGVEYPIRWVPIDHPDRAHDKETDGKGIYAQGLARGGATFARLEGAWYGGGKIFVTATSGGDAKKGQVWELDPAKKRLRLVYESPGAGTLNMPDNICVSPRGGSCSVRTETALVRARPDRRWPHFRFICNNALIEPGCASRRISAA
jgi:secreted PhoX family phosphatase